MKQSRSKRDTVESRYLELRFLEFCEVRNICLNQTFDCILQQYFGFKDFFTCSNYPKCKLICTSDNLNLQKIFPSTSRCQVLTVLLGHGAYKCLESWVWFRALCLTLSLESDFESWVLLWSWVWFLSLNWSPFWVWLSRESVFDYCVWPWVWNLTFNLGSNFESRVS